MATGATHGIWGGAILPGHYPQQLKRVYAQLTEQFEQRRHAELGHAPVATLAALDDLSAGHDDLFLQPGAA